MYAEANTFSTRMDDVSNVTFPGKNYFGKNHFSGAVP